MRADVFRLKNGQIDAWLESYAELAAFDPAGGLDRSGFVPTLPNILDVSSGYKEYSSHPHDMATQVAWIAYLFIAQRDGLERPDGFVPKSVLVEAVDGPYMTEAVRISLWSIDAPFVVASGSPIGVDLFKHPEGIPASYAPARWVIDNLFAIIVEEANKLIPLARAVAAEVRAAEERR